ncbi:MAG: hypothetical protein QOE69_468 [Thermoleophilaceae bacterium]|jgi:hypothetical protein|nr:hypothetical protein [Thermoleophilaceae bacterium]
MGAGEFPSSEQIEKYKERLAKLAAYGMTIPNVNAHAGTMLLRMACVRSLMGEAGERLTAEQALIQVIHEEIAEIADLPDGRLLAEILASDERAELRAGERQRRAGVVYYLGDKTISAETIRHTHQPRALLRLARRILRREYAARD